MYTIKRLPGTAWRQSPVTAGNKPVITYPCYRAAVWEGLLGAMCISLPGVICFREEAM